MKKVFLKGVMLCVALCLLPVCFAQASQVETTVAMIQKYGNLVLSISASDFLRHGYTYGDVITAEIGGSCVTMPVGSSYTDVDDGSPVCRVLLDSQTGEDYVILAVNMGDLATGLGIAQKVKIEEEPGYRWDMLTEEPVGVRFSMEEAGGYLGEYMLRRLVRTNKRADYAHLGDEAFANFRAIATTGMGENVLYRSSSPINPGLNRNRYADRALGEAKIRTVVNLADSLGQMLSYEGFAQSAYASCSVIPLNLGVDVLSEDFAAGLAKGLRFMLDNEGPYLVHCTEGKDRAGFVSALLECLMGASAQEVAADYMTTYANYYGVEPGTEQHSVIAERNIISTLQSAFGVENLYKADLSAEAEAYLQRQLGLTQAETDGLKARLAGE